MRPGLLSNYFADWIGWVDRGFLKEILAMWEPLSLLFLICCHHFYFITTIYDISIKCTATVASDSGLVVFGTSTDSDLNTSIVSNASMELVLSKNIESSNGTKEKKSKILILFQHLVFFFKKRAIHMRFDISFMWYIRNEKPH